jgi:hypothetical protein
MNYPEILKIKIVATLHKVGEKNLFNGEIQGLHAFKVRGQWRFS